MLAIALFGVSACTNGKSSLPQASAKKDEGGVVETSLNVAKNVVEAIPGVNQLAHTNDETKFSSREYGVAGSPRVSNQKLVRKGGGRYQVGKPYTVRGKRYHPREDENYKAVGLASWYGPNFHGRLTANGEVYDQYALTAAHPTLPLPSYVKVTNLENNSSVMVRVNDRGPFSKNRIIDLSARAAEMLGYTKRGVAKVKVEYAGKAPLHGLDEHYLVASYSSGNMDPRTIPPNARGAILLATARPAAQNRPYIPKFSAPVPEKRAAVARPQGLVQSFAAEAPVSNASSSALAWFNEPDTHSRETMDLPADSMASLEYLTFGPFQSLKAFNHAEAELNQYGHASMISHQDSTIMLRLATSVEESAAARRAAKVLGIEQISSTVR